MCLWNMISVLPFIGGLFCLYFALNLLMNGEILWAILLALFGIWSVVGGLRGMTRREWPHFVDSTNIQESQAMSTLTIKERERIFESEIAKYVRLGWHVVRRDKIGDSPFALLYRGNEACNLTMDDKGRFYPVILRRE